MTNAHKLTRHRDIQSWVKDRNGMPAIARVRNRFGEERSQLRLRFARPGLDREDGPMSPCSWTAWLAELDRQNLALEVDPSGRFTFVSRAALH